MKSLYILPLLLLSLLVFGCASSRDTDPVGEAPTPAPKESSGAMGTKTAYDGTTGSGLLMERYKAGQIEGYRE